MKQMKKLRQLLQQRPNVVAAYLFGSRAYGKPLGTSDYDVAVLFAEGYTLDDILDLTVGISDVFEADLDDVDVIALNDSPVELAYEAIAKGRLVYCADDEPRVDFEVKAVREYIELKPFLDLYYSLMIERLSKLHPE